MKEPVRSQDRTETDEERKRRLARERQRRHRAKLRRTSAANSAAASQSRHTQTHQAQDPVPQQQSAVTSDPRRSLISNPLSSTFPDQPYQQPKPAGGQHIQTHVLQYQRNAPEHEQGVGAVVGSIDAANLGHIRAQAPKRQTRRQTYYNPENRPLRDMTTESLSHGQQQPQQRSHADVLSVQKQSKSQPFQFQSSSSFPAHGPISESHNQPHDFHRKHPQQTSQQFAKPQILRGSQKRHSDKQRDAQQVLQEHQTRSPEQQRQSSHSVINHDHSNISFAVSVLPPEQITRRSTRDTGADVRRQSRNYPQSDPLQQVNSVPSQRVRQPQQMQDSQAHIQSGSPHRSNLHMGIALHSPNRQQSIFVSQQLPSQSPQPPPLQPQQSRHQSGEAHRQGRIYARLDRRQPDHSFQQRRSMGDGEIQVAHLEAGRQVNDLGRSGRKDDYRYGTRHYPDNSIPGFLESNVIGSLPLRTPDRQSILNEQHLQDQSTSNRANRSGHAVQSPGQMRKPEMALHRSQAQHQTAQQHQLDILTSSHHMTGQHFALASQEPSVTGYLQSHQPERQSTAPLGQPPHNSAQSQSIYLQHGHGSTTSQQHTPPMTRDKTSSLVAVAGESNLAAIPTAVNGMHVSAALASGTENSNALGAPRAGLASNQSGYGQGLNFPVVFAQGSVPKDSKLRRSRSPANYIEAVGTTSNGGETNEERKRRLARDRQRRRRKRLKLASGKGDEGKEEPIATAHAANVSMSQGNFSLNSNQNTAAVVAPESVRIPQIHGDAQVHVGFAQDHLPNEQQSHVAQHVPVAGATGKQSIGRGSFDGHILSASQSRTPNERPSSIGLSTVPQYSGAGASALTANAGDVVEAPPANETALERKRRLARDRQRRRRIKLRKREKNEQGIGSEAAPVPAPNVSIGPSRTRTSPGAVINHMVSTSRADSGRITRHGGMGPSTFSRRPGSSQPVFGDEQRVSRVNTSERDMASNMNTMQNPQVLPTGSADVSGGALGLTVGAESGLGRVSAVANEGLTRWNQVYRTETEARAAVEGAVSAFRRQLESTSEPERMFVLQHGIVRLAMLEGLPREKLNGILQEGVKAE